MRGLCSTLKRFPGQTSPTPSLPYLDTTRTPSYVRSSTVAAVDVIDEYVSALPGSTRRLGHAEWGITVAAESAAGHTLDVGLRITDGLVRAQAFALPAQPGVDPWLLLNWNRQTRLVRIGCTRSGDIWVHGDLPAEAIEPRSIDRLLGLVVEGSVIVREYAALVGAAETMPGAEGAALSDGEDASAAG